MDDAYIQTLINVEKKIFRLGDIQNIINIKHQRYRLSGIVSYKNLGKSGHYVAYVNNIINWYKYDDMHDKRCIKSEEEIVTPHVIMFIRV